MGPFSPSLYQAQRVSAHKTESVSGYVDGGGGGGGGELWKESEEGLDSRGAAHRREIAAMQLYQVILF